MIRKLKTTGRTIHLTFFTIALAISLAHGQEPELSTPDLFFAAVIVADMDTSLNWYRDVLGFQVVNRAENRERGVQQANLANGHSKLELIHISSATGNSDLSNGYFKVGVRVPDFDSWITHLNDLGVTFSGNVVTDPVSQKKMVVILDPDGNRVQFFEQ